MIQNLEVEAVILSDGTITDDDAVITAILALLEPHFGPVA
jgi:hypothetical protein